MTNGQNQEKEEPGAVEGAQSEAQVPGEVWGFSSPAQAPREGQEEKEKVRCHACDDTILAEAELTTCINWAARQWLAPELRVLDVGSGTSGHGAQIFRRQQLTQCDLLLGHDAREMPWAAESFDIVFLKRVLCQNDPISQIRIASEVDRVAAYRHAIIVVVEPWTSEYGTLNKLRAQAGLPPLPNPRSGGNLVSPALFTAQGWKLDEDHPIAPDYVAWTRYLCPAIIGRFPQYDELELRTLYPRLVGANQAAFYRLRTFIRE